MTKHTPKHTVVTMPGDGIGAAVLPEAVRVLQALRFDAQYIHADIGWRCWCEEGNPLPARTVELLREHRLGLFGAITSKPRREAVEELSPALRDEGFSYFSPILGLRQIFHLDICVRPCRTFPGNPLNFVRRRGKGLEEPPIDTVIFRQNTEGMYAGIADEAEEVELRVFSVAVFDGFEKHFVLEECSLANFFGESHRFLIDDSAGPDVLVADFAVAHGSGG